VYGQRKLIGRIPVQETKDDQPDDSILKAVPAKEASTAHTEQTSSVHDLNHSYFSKDAIILGNLDLFRARDLFFVTSLIYAILFTSLGRLSVASWQNVHLAHALFWRAFHSVGLGTLLHRQSTDRWFVRHFFKHYYFKSEPAVSVVREAFSNWVAIYNFSLTMTYLSFVLLAFTSLKPFDMADWSFELLRCIVGMALIALHIWTAKATHEVLGSFGWFVSAIYRCCLLWA
jgi:phosphatidylethanolamine N-methyltransferase